MIYDTASLLFTNFYLLKEASKLMTGMPICTMRMAVR